MLIMIKYICLNCFKIELILWDNGNYATCKICSKTFTKEEMLKKMETFSFRLLAHNFTVINFGLQDPTYEPGMVSTTIRQVQCPLCKNIFNQKVVSGYFNINITPRDCPKCGYYYSMHMLKYKLKCGKDSACMGKTEDYD